MRVFVTGGGTGGHIYPAIAIIEKLLDTFKNIEIYYIGNKKSPEERIVTNSNLKINFIYLKTAGFFNKPLIQKLPAILYLFQSLFRIINIFKLYKPTFVIGTGGYVSVPVLIASIIFKVPFALQEQNILPGWSNQFFSHFANFVFLGFKESQMFFKKKNNLLYTGNPIRKDFYNLKKHSKNLKDRIIIMGGSGGAKSINTIIHDVVKEFQNYNDIFVHITGVRDYEKVLDLKEPDIKNYVVHPYVNKIWDELNRAKLVICRAGAITISEILVLKIPLILIPYPYAVKNHQYWNAFKFKKLGIAEIIENKDLNKKVLVETIHKYLKSDELIKSIENKYENFKINNALETIVNIIKPYLELKV